MSPPRPSRRPATPAPTTVSSVDNALRLLLMFQDHKQVRVSDAAAELGTALSTAHRLMSALARRGFVEQDSSTRAYVAGSVLTDIGLAVVQDMGIRVTMRPYMESLCRDVGETIQLMVLQRADIQFVGSVETSKALRVASRLGQTMPAHCSSGGKALLAELSPGELRRLYPSGRLQARTDRSITELSVLEAELARVRRRGYATADGEGEPDVAAVAVVLRDSLGTPRAALAASGPRSRVKGRAIPAIAESLRWVADQAAAQLV
jgi:IclR family acetate operon transcriptional repressor